MERPEIHVPPITIVVPRNPPPGDAGFALDVADDDDGCVRIYVGTELSAYITPQGQFKVRLSKDREIVYTRRDDESD